MADAGLRLVVEGEKEFKAAVASCDEAVKQNQKSLKLLSEEFKLNEAGMKDMSSGFGSMADAAEILTTKGKVLADSIGKQTEKVELLRQKVKEAAGTYGEHDKRTEALRSQLLDASAALAKMTAEQERNRQAILDAEHSTKEYDDAVKALEAQLAANQAELKAMGGGLDALKKEYGALEKESGTLEKSTGSLGKGFLTLGRQTADLEKQEELLQKKEENLGKQNEALEKQNEKLADSIIKQKQVTETLSQAQQTATERFGKGSQEAEAYRKRLADATGQLDAMERELKENQKAIEDNNKAIEAGGDAPNAMLDGLKQIEEMTGIKIPAGIETMIGGFDGGTLAVGGIVGALGLVASKMADIYKDTLGWSRDLTTSAQELDLGVEEYQAMEYAAAKAGIPVEYMRTAIEKINKKITESDAVLGDWIGRMDELQYASSDVKEAVAEEMNWWNRLGITLYDNEGKLKSTHDLMYEVIDAMGQLDSKTEKDQIAMEIFGQKLSKINPLIETGAADLKAFEEEAYRTGVVLDEYTVGKLNDTGAAFDVLGMRIDAAKKKLAAGLNWTDFIPGLNEITFLTKLPDLFKTLFGISGKGYASGTNYAPGGLALVGERGPEIVDLPRGSKVYPNGTVPQLSGGTVYETNTYNVTIDASSVEEFNDIVRIAQNARVGMRRG